MSKLLEEPKVAGYEPAARCPHYDEDCKHVRDHVGCWSYTGDDGPFPGVCPFVFGEEPK